jgi:hypothetical protein
VGRKVVVVSSPETVSFGRRLVFRFLARGSDVLPRPDSRDDEPDARASVTAADPDHDPDAASGSEYLDDRIRFDE